MKSAGYSRVFDKLFFQSKVKNEIRGGFAGLMNFEKYSLWILRGIRGGGRGVWSEIGTFWQFEKHDSSFQMKIEENYMKSPDKLTDFFEIGEGLTVN